MTDFDSQVLRLAAQSNEEVMELFDTYFDDLGRLGIHTPKQGGLFSFERDVPPQYREKVDALTRSFQINLYNIIHNGIDAAYGISTTKGNALLRAIFPDGINLHAPRQKEAREAFVRHREKPEGRLGLSDRIWNYSNQGRAEVEAAMSLAIEDGVVKGTSAAELGREIRKYLNDPDRMYRRYHKKKVNARGETVDQIVWKKRVLDDEGHVRFVDAELEAVGQGVYRSARANAERCTRSEINGAYRYADYDRWQSEEFVIGIKISLSNNHTTLKMIGGKKLRVPFHDICDDLQGIYPKTLKWPGWHPQCRCHVTPVMADKASRMQWLSEGCPKGFFDDQYITAAPPQMTQWLMENKSKVLRARSLPYWIQDNLHLVRTPKGEEMKFDLMGIGMKKPAALVMPKAKLTPLEIAAQRHAKRTTEDIRDIQNRWNKRKNDRTKDELRSLLAGVEKSDFTKKIKHDIGQLYIDKRTGLYHAGKVDDIRRRLDIAQAATERHAARNPQAILKAWNDRISTRKYARRVLDIGKSTDGVSTRALTMALKHSNDQKLLKEAYKVRDAIKATTVVGTEERALVAELEGIKDVDTSKLKKLLAAKTKNATEIKREYEKLKKVKEEIESLTLLDNPLKVARETSLAEAKTIEENVKRTLGKMSTTSLDSRKRSLEYEIKWMETTGKDRYPATYKYSRDAYKKELAIVEQKIKVKSIEDSLEEAFKWMETSSKDQRLIDMVKEIKKDLANPSLSLKEIQAKADQIKLFYAAEYRTVKKWIDLEEKARLAIEYAETSKSKMYKASAEELKTLLADRTKKFESVEKKADALIAKYEEQMKKAIAKRGADSGYKVETLDELRKRLGDKTPGTINHLDRAIKDYEHSKKYGFDAAANEDEIAEVMRDLFAKHDYGMNIDDKLLSKVFTSKFKNTFEVGKSGGYLGSTSTTGPIEKTHERLKAAHILFGMGDDLAKDQLERAAYEKYGNLLDHDILRSMNNNTARGYGNVEVRFKKDKVICTWTAGDSLGKKWQPTLTTDPKACSYDNVDSNSTNYITLPTKASDTTNLVEFKKKHISGYLELQYHGELGIDAVESLAFPYDITTSQYLSIATKWKNIGVKIYYIDKNGLLKEL